MSDNREVALTREKILETALQVLRSYSLADLSMRRLATELGVAPGALYYHVRNKQELLASLASRLLAGVTLEREVAHSLTAPLVVAGENLYQKLIPVKESSEVIRLALAFQPVIEDSDRLTLRDEFEDYFTRVLGTAQPALAADSLLHLALSFIEQEQTRALLTGGDPPKQPPASYSTALTALIAGFTPQSTSQKDSRDPSR